MGFGDDLPDDFFAGHGGVAGLHQVPRLRMARSHGPGRGCGWRNARRRTSPSCSSRELGDPEGPFEVGRDGDRRVTWQVDPGPLAKDDPAIELGPDSTILITGGARGITAKVALELASPLPAAARAGRQFTRTGG